MSEPSTLRSCPKVRVCLRAGVVFTVRPGLVPMEEPQPPAQSGRGKSDGPGRMLKSKIETSAAYLFAAARDKSVETHLRRQRKGQRKAVKRSAKGSEKDGGEGGGVLGRVDGLNGPAGRGGLAEEQLADTEDSAGGLACGTPPVVMQGEDEDEDEENEDEENEDEENEEDGAGGRVCLCAVCAGQICCVAFAAAVKARYRGA